ncbi:MAG: endoribonuclease MazF [Candidatus Pacebacteria bacterium]|nr:endoribonuclease MazF [Candidatus Paceibacterota bacterium]
MVKKYIPERGDIVWLDFDPTKGHEQKGRRPAFVLSLKSYNKKSGLVLFCPVTSISKKYPFEVIVNNCPIDGVILVDQIKSLDWDKRKIEFICRLDADILEEVIKKVLVLVK